MHSIASRINFVLTYTLAILLALTICLSILPIPFERQAESNASTNRHYLNASNETVIKNRHYAIVAFDLQANLNAVFNWNIKEL